MKVHFLTISDIAAGSPSREAYGYMAMKNVFPSYSVKKTDSVSYLFQCTEDFNIKVSTLSK